jgi:hypothetical protein
MRQTFVEKYSVVCREFLHIFRFALVVGMLCRKMGKTIGG